MFCKATTIVWVANLISLMVCSCGHWLTVLNHYMPDLYEQTEELTCSLLGHDILI